MADKKSSVWTSLPMQMMFGLVLGVVVGAFTNPNSRRPGSVRWATCSFV